MGEYLDQIPEDLQGHIKDITKSSGLEDNEESLEMMAKAWIEKKEVFEETIMNLNMEEFDTFEKDDEKGALVLTYSGSLVNIGPLVDDARNVEYTSITIRGDVPDSAKGGDAKLGGDIKVDEEIEFEAGPIKSTSAAFKIAVCKGDLSIEEQEENLSKATMMLSNEFSKINKTIITE